MDLVKSDGPPTRRQRSKPAEYNSNGRYGVKRQNFVWGPERRAYVHAICMLKNTDEAFRLHPPKKCGLTETWLFDMFCRHYPEVVAEMEAETGKKLKPGDLMSRVGQFWRRNKDRTVCVYGEEHPKNNTTTKDRLHWFRADLEARLAKAR